MTAATSTAYTVTVTREDNLWVADIDGMPSNFIGATDVERFSDLDIEVRDLIAGLTDADPDDFAINWRYVVNGHDVTDQFHRFLAIEAELREQMRRESELRAARDQARVALPRDLSEAGLSQRAIGDAVDLSHQRVSQLFNSC